MPFCFLLFLSKKMNNAKKRQETYFRCNPYNMGIFSSGL